MKMKLGEHRPFRQPRRRAARMALAVAAVLAWPCAANANVEAWEGINRDIEKLLLYLDRASITQEGQTKSAWLLFDYRAPQPLPAGFGQYQSVKARVAVNCAHQTYTRTEEIKYAGPHASGNVVSTYAWKPDERIFEKAVPFTNSQAVVDSICHTPAGPGR